MNSYINKGLGGTYLSAYGIAVKHGFPGTEREWLESLKGKNRLLELKFDTSNNMLLWKSADEEAWNELMPIDTIIDMLDEEIRKGLERDLNELETELKDELQKITEFTYYCTGKDDNIAVQNIINNFYSSDTAMTMKLEIVGTMGITQGAQNKCISIYADNDRKATCFIDFKNCDIPKINTAPTHFMAIATASARLNISGLNVTTTGAGIYFNAGGSDNTFNHYRITSGNSSGVLFESSFYNSNHNTFNNCILAGTYGGVTFKSSVYCKNENNIFNDCIIDAPFYSDCLSLEGSDSNNTIFNNCTMISSISLSGSNNKFNNCTMSSEGCTVRIVKGINNEFSNCVIIADSPNSESAAIGVGTNGDIYHNRFCNCKIHVDNINNPIAAVGADLGGGSCGIIFDNCNIQSSGYGMRFGSSFSGITNINSCTIIGGAYAIYVDAANTGVIIRITKCSLVGGAMGLGYDIYQQSASSTISWYIIGNVFASNKIYINGGEKSASANTTNAYLYMPAYANMFDRAIDTEQFL